MPPLDDGCHKNNGSASCHETTKYWTHQEQGILSGINMFNNCHHEALIVVLPCFIPSFSMKYWTINVYGCESKHMSCNNEQLWFIICIDKSNIATHTKHLGVTRWFHATNVIPILTFFLHNKYQRGYGMQMLLCPCNNVK